MALPKPGFLRVAWNLAWPYWTGDQKWSARGLLGAVVAAEPDLGMAQCPPQRLERAILQRASGIQLAGILVAIRDLRDDRGVADRRRGISALSAADPADPLARLADRPVPERLARRTRPITGCSSTTRRPTTRTSASRTTSTATPSVSLALSIGLMNSVVTLFSFLFILWTLSGILSIPLGGGRSFDIPGYMVYRRDSLRGGRHLADASHRQPAGPAALRPAALRGRFPLQHGAAARERRERRVLWRREPRARGVPQPLYARRAELVGHHPPPQEADLVHLPAIRRWRSCFRSSSRRRAISRRRSSSAG